MAEHAHIRRAERAVFDHYSIACDEHRIALPHNASTVRVISMGQGPPVLLLHGATFCAATWAPLLAELGGVRLHALDLPGHGLSGPGDYRLGFLRGFAHQLLDQVWEEFGSEPMRVIANSLGSMIALWYAARRPERVATVVALGAPAIAFPGTVVRMPLALLNVPYAGQAMLRTPLPRWAYRSLLATGLGSSAARSMPDALVDVLRFSARSHARNLAALNHAMNRLTRPRAENVMSTAELAQLSCRPLFIWGSQDPYLSAQAARPHLAAIRGASLVEITGGHSPWIEHPGRCAQLIAAHLAAAHIAHTNDQRGDYPSTTTAEDS